MGLEVLLAGAAQFHCHEFVATLLETLDNCYFTKLRASFLNLDDLANKSALDTVGFDSDEGTFSGHSLKFFDFFFNSKICFIN